MKRNIEGFPELDMYDTSEDLHNMLSLEPCDYCKMVPFDTSAFEKDEFERKELGSYEIVFEVKGERFYCYIAATNLVEALGWFFVTHPHITYEHIVEHMEV